MNSCIIGVGSNIEPEKNIALARVALARDHSWVAESPFLQTKPVGFKDQPDFHNGAFLIQTDLSLDALQSYLKNLELKLGRIPSDHTHGPRTMDLDIVVWNGVLIDDDYYERDYLKKSVDSLLEPRCPNKHHK
jgi:2-amino-4-hydroxy-6-hydroxymethyldihydropteridine diphosphokinase